MKPRLLYIDHAYHQKTKSNVFLSDLFSEHFEIDFWYIDVDRLEDLTVPSMFRAKSYDLLIMFQVLLPRGLLDRTSFRRGIFVPMFDGQIFGTDPRLFDYRDFLFLNFSWKLHLQYHAAGLNSFYLKYFPEPKEGCRPGDPRKAFFWARTEQITPDMILKLLQGTKVNSLHIHRSPDPHHRYQPPSATLRKGIRITESTWFEDKADLLAIVEDCAIYFAPRISEGIGLSFLDAMAMGRFVVAPDHPTMNEYVIHGRNGLLYDDRHPSRLLFPDIADVQRQTLKMHAEGREAWNEQSTGLSEMAITREIRVPLRVVLDAGTLTSGCQSGHGERGHASSVVALVKRLYFRDDLVLSFYGTPETKGETARILAEILGHDDARIYCDDDFLGEIDAFIATTGEFPPHIEKLRTMRLYRLGAAPTVSLDCGDSGHSGQTPCEPGLPTQAQPGFGRASESMESVAAARFENTPKYSETMTDCRHASVAWPALGPMKSGAEWANEIAAKILSDVAGELPAITVVTVVRNLESSGETVRMRRLARSVARQVYSGQIEHLMVDLGSDDGTLDVLRKLTASDFSGTSHSSRPPGESHRESDAETRTHFQPGSDPHSALMELVDAAPGKGCIQKVLSTSEQCRGAAMLNALEEASGEYVVFIHHDSYLHDPYGLTYAMRAILRSDAAWCYGHARSIVSRTRCHEIWRGVQAALPFGAQFCQQTLIAQKAVLQALPGLDSSQDYRASADFAGRLNEHGYAGICCDHVWLTVRESIAREGNRHMPRITVITTTKDNLRSGMQQALRQNLDSVRAQKTESLEIEHLFIDGNSQDGTVEFLSDLAGDDESFRIVSEPDTGIYEAMNKGLRQARGEIIVFLNSDDYFCSDTAVLDSVTAIDRAGADFSYAWFREISRDGTIVRERTAEIGLFYWRMPFSHQTMFVRKAALQAIGGFRETMFRSAGDYDMILRLLLGGAKSVQVPSVMVHFRLGGMSSNQEQSHRECYKALNDVLGNFWHFRDEAEVESYFNGTHIPLGLFLKIQKMVSEDVLLAMNDLYRNDFIHEPGYLAYPNQALSAYFTDVETATRNRAAVLGAVSATHYTTHTSQKHNTITKGAPGRSMAFDFLKGLIPDGRFRRIVRGVYRRFMATVDSAPP